MLAPDYDAGDSSPTSEVQASAYQDTVEDVPWRNQTCRLSVESMFPSGARKYVRDGNAAGDIRLYDSGTLFVCTLDQADSSAIGKLWVTYDVEFFVPQIENSSPLPSNAFLATLASDQSYTSTVPAVIGFDTIIYNSLGISNTSGVFTLPRGAYKITADIHSNDNTAEAFTADFELRKNSASLSPVVRSISKTVPGSSSAAMEVPLNYFVVSDGDDTFSILGTLTGAAGTLSVRTQRTRILIQCA
jgi:hypothetical protein